MVFSSRARAPPASVMIDLPLRKSPADGGAEALTASGGEGASIAQMYILRSLQGIDP